MASKKYKNKIYSVFLVIKKLPTKIPFKCSIVIWVFRWNDINGSPNQLGWKKIFNDLMELSQLSVKGKKPIFDFFFDINFEFVYFCIRKQNLGGRVVLFGSDSWHRHGLMPINDCIVWQWISDVYIHTHWHRRTHTRIQCFSRIINMDWSEKLIWNNASNRVKSNGWVLLTCWLAHCSNNLWWLVKSPK